MDKPIIDVCCGSRMFWFNKNNPNVIFGDNRQLNDILCDGRKLEINPDVVMDFRNIPFKDSSFKLVIFDPPHLNQLGQNSWMGKKYGVLLPSWESDLRQGFEECLRILEPFGVLVFKWNESQIKVSKILGIFGQNPLIGHKSGKNSNTQWMLFMKGIG